MREYYVYILLCSDGSFYTGVTYNIELRVAQHIGGFNPSCYTFTRRPVQCVYVCTFDDIYDAISFEKKLKRWSRKKKEALINGEYTKLMDLSAMKGDWSIATVVRTTRFITRLCIKKKKQIALQK